MNTALVTGYLVKDATLAFTPGGQRKLIFTVMVKQADGEIIPWTCETADPALIDRGLSLATAGRAVILQAEITGRTTKTNGVPTGWHRYLNVMSAEFPDRSGARRADDKPIEPAA